MEMVLILYVRLDKQWVQDPGRTLARGEHGFASQPHWAQASERTLVIKAVQSCSHRCSPLDPGTLSELFHSDFRGPRELLTRTLVQSPTVHVCVFYLHVCLLFMPLNVSTNMSSNNI